MWRDAGGAIYLEPGEVALLAELARRAAPEGPQAPTHPGTLMLQALAAALSAWVDRPGVILAPAPVLTARRAARAHLLAGDPGPR